MSENGVQAIASALRRHPLVASLEFSGSRARGTATIHSDWDFLVRTHDFARLKSEIATFLASHRPLALQWDRLSDVACCMLLLQGPEKVDLIFPEVPQRVEPPWSVSRETLLGIDDHFWDWILWLIAKQAGGKDELVRSELRKMWHHLLDPLGAPAAPADLESAVRKYLELRDGAEKRLSIRISRRLEHEVLPRLRTVFASGCEGGSRL